ncbi:LutC/YkgG family protein [Gluconacetobacter tumulicola]|uniref:LUD domain-containing protein n=1 Tax=Gluconacetobacter tumulicola TaxID=1017177 RepID=A0A7W4JB67_9PROT|nr:LUD domain-containing protein [Gluconacetobacter tumulicola]MBB2178042.1 LUD domain-containing protein [Gluconacetobacter tumulicola]
MSARDTILATLRRNSPDPAAHPLPDPALLGESDASPERFSASLTQMGGTMLDCHPDEPLDQAIARRFPKPGLMICSLVPEATGTVQIEDLPTPQSAEPVDVTIVRAAFGIAETGSIFLSESQLHLNAIAHLTQHMVVLLDPAQITANMHTAYLRPEFHTARYGVLMSGPSATADIQGVLIRGAQGVRSLAVCFAPQ